MSDLDELRTESYLVRFWHSNPHSPWRARLTNVRTGWTRYFVQPEDLWNCLWAEIGYHVTQKTSLAEPRLSGKDKT